jgi:hypothetical protein
MFGMNETVHTETQVQTPAQFIPACLAIRAMRDSGYKNTAYALAELIDNAQQANASLIEVFCLQKREVVEQRERSRIVEIGVLDDGDGMDATTLRMALQFGNGTRLNDRSGIGRFGMGLPNASISQAARLDVWSWQNGPDNALHTFLDVDEVESGVTEYVPEPEHEPVPSDWRDLSAQLGNSGTLVVWSKIDINRLTWKSARSTLLNTERLIGRIYRRFLLDGSLIIRLVAPDVGGGTSFDKEACFDDPLYLTPAAKVPAPFDQTAMFESVFEDPQEIEFGGKKHIVNMRFSVATKKTIDEAGSADRGQTAYGRHARNNIGVSLLRAGRELVLDAGWCIGYDPRERWWGAEVEFDPALDELFGVTNNKQAATHFSELATTEWEQLAEEGENFLDVVNRLKAEGDPRGWLLVLSDSLKRNLKHLRELIKAQASGGRSTRRKRHQEPDDVTNTVNKGWKDRSKETPIEGEDTPKTKEDFVEIKEDLTQNKKYSDEAADELVSLIKDADLRVVFLEAAFPDSYHLFNVEIKGKVTEVTFNRSHPAFDDIFGTINTVDEDITDLTREEVLSRLMRAVNATKIIFAGWARYEREAGMERARALQKVRFEWGQIAAKFLDPDDNLAL